MAEDDATESEDSSEDFEDANDASEPPQDSGPSKANRVQRQPVTSGMDTEEGSASLPTPAKPEHSKGNLGRGRGEGRGSGGKDGGRGQQKGRGGGKEVIPWLCPFCHHPTGTEALHNSKQCNRPLKIPPPAELQWSRCAICNHSHPWMECPILYDSRLGYCVIPQPFMEIAERLGYQPLMVGARKMISVASLLPQMPSKAVSHGGSTSSSQSSLASSSVSDMSTAVFDGGTQEVLSLVRQQGTEILGQVSSLKDVVTELSTGQQSLFSKQSELQGQLAAQAATSLKMMTAWSTMKEEFKTFRTEQEKTFATEKAKYQETMDKLNELLAIEDTGVKGPLDGMEQE